MKGYLIPPETRQISNKTPKLTSQGTSKKKKKEIKTKVNGRK